MYPSVGGVSWARGGFLINLKRVDVKFNGMSGNIVVTLSLSRSKTKQYVNPDPICDAAGQSRGSCCMFNQSKNRFRKRKEMSSRFGEKLKKKKTPK
jgi:hypothetical protein